MAKFDRYILSQLLALFGFFSLILVMVYWINRAVRLFDQLIADGQSATVFLEFTVLSLPSVIRIALPLAAFAASVYVTNRLSQDSELVAVQATGFSPYRIARPVLYFGIVVFIFMSALVHILGPFSTARLQERQAEISKTMSARLLTPGTFIEPTKMLTFYVREITETGELRGLFLSDQRNAKAHANYTARQAYLLRSEENTQLVMIDGLIQTLTVEDNTLFTTSFAEFAYDISDVLTPSNTNTLRNSSTVPTSELLFPTDTLVEETKLNSARLISIGHNRFSQSLMAIVAALLGYSALMIGGYSRFGVWRQIVVAIFLIIIVKATETVGLNLARSNPSYWAATYTPIVIGCGICWIMLHLASRPRVLRRKYARPAS